MVKSDLILNYIFEDVFEYINKFNHTIDDLENLKKYYISKYLKNNNLIYDFDSFSYFFSINQIKIDFFSESEYSRTLDDIHSYFSEDDYYFFTYFSSLTFRILNKLLNIYYYFIFENNVELIFKHINSLNNQELDLLTFKIECFNDLIKTKITQNTLFSAYIKNTLYNNLDSNLKPFKHYFVNNIKFNTNLYFNSLYEYVLKDLDFCLEEEIKNKLFNFIISLDFKNLENPNDIFESYLKFLKSNF